MTLGGSGNSTAKGILLFYTSLEAWPRSTLAMNNAERGCRGFGLMQLGSWWCCVEKVSTD